MLLIHGTTDDIVPFQQAVLMHEALDAVGVESTLVAFEGVDHALYGYSVQVWENLLAFFKRHLGDPANYGDRSVTRIDTRNMGTP